jgi:hypothetical protein
MDALAKEVLDVAYDNGCMVDGINLNASNA